MKTEIWGIIIQIVLMLGLAYPLGRYISRVYKGEKTFLDFLKPVEKFIFKISGISSNKEMNWKEFLRAMLIINLFWFIWAIVLLMIQGHLPLNPDGNTGQSFHQAFNTAISFLVNCKSCS